MPVRVVCLAMVAAGCALNAAGAAPPGYVKRTLPLDATPVALAFDSAGLLYALEEAPAGSNIATMRVFDVAGAPVTSFPVTGDDEFRFFVGGMAYDPVGDRLLVTDNSTDGRIYAVGKTGGQLPLASAIPGIADIAVRSTGEIVISTSIGFGNGGVYQIDRATGAKTLKMLGLDYGAGLAFDAEDNLVVQDSASIAPYRGRLQRVEVQGGPAGLEFGNSALILSGMSAAYDVALDDAGELFASGRGGVFTVAGSPPVEVLFDSNGRPNQFAASMAFRPGPASFEPFAGPGGGLLAFAADGGFFDEDLFVTLLTPARSEDFNSDGVVDGADLAAWASHFGNSMAARHEGDANADGLVDGADLLRWQRAVGESSLPSNSAMWSVPEPGLGAALLLIVFLRPAAFLSRSRR